MGIECAYTHFFINIPGEGTDGFERDTSIYTRV